MIQSFAPGEVTPEQAMQIGEELCDRYLKGDYQYVIAVHHDKSHLHCHIIFNNTNLYNGLSFTTEHNQGRKSERAWAELREISDEICAEHGISVIEPIDKSVSDEATVFTFGVDTGVASLAPSSVNFEQTEALTTNGIAVQKFGALIIPASKSATECTLVATIGDTVYTASTTITASQNVGATITLQKGV